MDSKNVIAAIALSSAVIVLYSLFFIPEQTSQNQNLLEKEKIEQNTDTPSLEQKETLVTISREEALNQNERIEFENNNIIGSISLKGASIDDLTFKNYKVDLNDEKIVYGNNEIKFDVDPFKKKCLLEGLDDIALSLKKSEKIESFETDLKNKKPWIFND